jgi:uncharacterized Zn-finger protein
LKRVRRSKAQRRESLYSFERYLKQHKKICGVDKDEREIFRCQVCQRAFSSKQYLDEHKRIHEEDEEKRRPFECDFPGCGKRFAQQSHLDYHKRTTHEEDEEKRKPFRCEVCRKAFSSKQYLKTHKCGGGRGL